ncbi:EYxxD motif small membrane protein [Mesobacillus harenae]
MSRLSWYWDYVNHVSFVLIAIIGSIIALLFVYIRKPGKKRL